ncbi:MAG: hypothetical protein Q9195_007191 [Heterodermia aff. obscurata]
MDATSEKAIDIARHSGTEPLVGPIPRPTIGGNFMLHENVIKVEQNNSRCANSVGATEFCTGTVCVGAFIVDKDLTRTFYLRHFETLGKQPPDPVKFTELGAQSEQQELRQKPQAQLPGVGTWVFDDMTQLCKMFCPGDFGSTMNEDEAEEVEEPGEIEEAID